MPTCTRCRLCISLTRIIQRSGPLHGATPNPTASLSAGIQSSGHRAPDVAAFSSRGPALAGAGDLLKPDIMAPGVDVLAAMSPIEVGRDFDFLSGTSMSSPHIAGIAALFKQKLPELVARGDQVGVDDHGEPDA